MANTFDLTIQAGDDVDLVVSWLPDGELPNLVSASATMVISYDEHRSATGVTEAGTVTFTSADGDITFDTGTGDVTVFLAGADTADIPPSYATYQLRVTDGDGVKTTIASGKLTALKNLVVA